MAAEFRKALPGRTEIDIAVTGRRSGRRIVITVWFVQQDATLYLLPVSGSDTQWYRNVVVEPTLELRAGRKRVSARAKTITDRTELRKVIDLFRAKHGDADVKRYYRKLDVAVAVRLART